MLVLLPKLDSNGQRHPVCIKFLYTSPPRDEHTGGVHFWLFCALLVASRSMLA